jgi:hypothetical protein
MSGITVLPGVYYNEKVDNINYGGNGEIPCFIGRTNNKGTDTAPVDGTRITEYSLYSDVSKSVAEGGIGATGKEETDLKTNPLLQVLKDFFAETEPLNYNDLSVEHIYVIDVGDGSSLDAWKNAFETAKKYRDINIEVYYGLESLKTSMQKGIDEAMLSIQRECKKLDLRRAFFTVETDTGGKTTTDTYLISLAGANTSYNRLVLCEPANFGKIIGRFCVTPLGEEAGYYTFNTVAKGVFTARTPKERLALQNAGVTFCSDEYTSSTFYPKINLGVCTCFGNQTGDRPADSLDSSRRIADYMLRQVFDVCYSQIKARETRTQLTILQTQINTIVENMISDGYVVAYNEESNPIGTQLSVSESDSNPYAMIVSGTIQPVNCTIAIDIEAEITQPAMQSTQEA